MKILFIAPIPPPINGQSKASLVLLEALNSKHQVDVVNLSKSTLKNGALSVTRISEILSNIRRIYGKQNNQDIIYISLAESFAGNIRDIVFYCLSRKNLSRTFIHMLGGAGMKEILGGTGIMQKINAHFMKKMAGVIVEGPVNFETFKTVFPEDRIHIVPNFAEDFLFVSEREINDKFDNLSVINVLYLSNLIPGKGYDELADAFILLELDEKTQLNITFVGGFENVESERAFLNKIKPLPQLKYLGKFIDGQQKRELYCESHVFCLPTYYPFEGQPISILEAYATGCAVITSDHSGIPFIFKDQQNGFLVEKKSIISLKKALLKLISRKDDLKRIAKFNRIESFKKYRTEIFQNTIIEIFEDFIVEGKNK
ncbi:MAG TPA: glycosyltransferase family 4 protein [Sphingobacteriaceae bacterium]|nr:glycosyltransferase family 4 protein [Sphingobacteriaceae bacterium]